MRILLPRFRHAFLIVCAVAALVGAWLMGRQMGTASQATLPSAAQQVLLPSARPVQTEPAPAAMEATPPNKLAVAMPLDATSATTNTSPTMSVTPYLAVNDLDMTSLS